MARARRGRTTRARRTPAERSRRYSDNRLQAPAVERIDWNEPPKQFHFPLARKLKDLSINELNNLLMRFGIAESWSQARVANVGYIQRMSDIPPGSSAFADEIERLLDLESKRGALGATRRAYREYTLVDALQGESVVDLIWIADGNEATCARCNARGGDIGTVQYHSSKGLPGPAVCEGGDLCRCQLVPID